MYHSMLLYGYCQKNYVDLVPKTIMRFLVLAFKENLQNHLVAELYKYVATSAVCTMIVQLLIVGLYAIGSKSWLTI